MLVSRLNRTSVGLKLTLLLIFPDAAMRLNRTSVGLKPHSLGASRSGLARPQSNQRGIETSHYKIRVESEE